MTIQAGYLSKYVSEGEFLYSAKANELHIRNVFANSVHRNNAIYLCTNYIDAIRDYYNKPVIITSGYRCPLLNSKIGGVGNSLHSVGGAADFHVEGIPLKQVWNDIVTGKIKFAKPWEELIWEFSGAWVHFGYAPTFHKEIWESYYTQVNNKKVVKYRKIFTV